MGSGVYGVPAEEAPIGSITNGVHVPTWLAPEAEALYTKHLGQSWRRHGPGDDPWAKAASVTDEELWALRRVLRAKLATYKRAPLVIKEAARLAALMCDPTRPVQLVFAGKAHPRDADGQDMARAVHEHARAAGFAGRVALIEEYDMHVGRVLTSGADVWLNNPIRPNEASGTSGMKPPLHGGLNASILDGWWPEGFDGENGWAIAADDTDDATGSAGAMAPMAVLAESTTQDALDARALLTLLEEDLVPLFYARDSAGLPRGWLAKARRSFVTIPGRFNTHRMVGESLRDAYVR